MMRFPDPRTGAEIQPHDTLPDSFPFELVNYVTAGVMQLDFADTEDEQHADPAVAVPS